MARPRTEISDRAPRAPIISLQTFAGARTNDRLAALVGYNTVAAGQADKVLPQAAANASVLGGWAATFSATAVAEVGALQRAKTDNAELVRLVDACVAAGLRAC